MPVILYTISEAVFPWRLFALAQHGGKIHTFGAVTQAHPDPGDLSNRGQTEEFGAPPLRHASKQGVRQSRWQSQPCRVPRGCLSFPKASTRVN